MKTPNPTHSFRRLTAVVLASLPQLGCVSDLEYELHRYDGHAEAGAPSHESESDSRQVTDLAIDDDAVPKHPNPSMIDAATSTSAVDSPPAGGSSGDDPPPSAPPRDAMTTVTAGPEPITEEYEEASSPASDESPDHSECDAGTCGSDAELDGTAASEAGCWPQPCADDPGVIGTACADSDECASGRCLEGKCIELDLIISSAGVEEQDFLFVHFVIERGTAAVNWEDLAFLYFFTPEVHYDFRTAYDSDSESTRLCVELDTDLWAYVWRSSKIGPVQWLETSFSAQVHDETWVPMSNANDYSYAEAAGPNPNVVVCRHAGDRWVYAQGNVPPGVDDPCWVVEPDCSQVSCDDPTN